jgi:hypothetical protein
VAGYCEHNNELSVSINCLKYLEILRGEKTTGFSKKAQLYGVTCLGISPILELIYMSREYKRSMGYGK